MGSTWGPPGSCQLQMGPMLAPWTLLSGIICGIEITDNSPLCCGIMIWSVLSNKVTSDTYTFPKMVRYWVFLVCFWVFLTIILRTYGMNDPKFGMIMYPDHLFWPCSADLYSYITIFNSQWVRANFGFPVINLRMHERNSLKFGMMKNLDKVETWLDFNYHSLVIFGWDVWSYFWCIASGCDHSALEG